MTPEGWVAMVVLSALSGALGFWVGQWRGIQLRQKALADQWEEFYGPTEFSKTRRYGQ